MKKFETCKVCNGEITLINQKYSLGECMSCKLIFCTHWFSQEQLIKVYDDLYNKNITHYQKHSKDEFEALLHHKKIRIGYNRKKLIHKNILNGTCESVLEIGSGIGLLGSYIRLKNPSIDYIGVEIDTEAFNKSKQLGLNTINADFKEIEHFNQSFDVIMLWEVLEHLQDLKLFIDLAYKKLNINGKIILSTPNYNKIYNYSNRYEDQIFQDEPPIHLNFFTKENIINVFEKGSFSNCKVRVKKIPYIELNKIRFYKNCFKSFLNKYNGPTIYFEGTK